jgi:hypothetical protein
VNTPAHDTTVEASRAPLTLAPLGPGRRAGVRVSPGCRAKGRAVALFVYILIAAAEVRFAIAAMVAVVASMAFVKADLADRTRPQPAESWPRIAPLGYFLVCTFT